MDETDVASGARRRRWRWVWPVAGLIVATVVGAAALRAPAPVEFRAGGPARPLPSGPKMVQVSEEDFEGILVGQRGRRPVVVNVWASWCAPCRTEMPLLDRAAESYQGRVTVLGVASNDSRDAAQTFLDDLGISYPNVFDLDGGIRVELELSAYPTTYVFGRDGRLRATVKGGISEQRLAGLIEDALR